MGQYDWIHDDSPCKTCLLKYPSAGASRRCVEYKRFGGECQGRGPFLLRCSTYIGPLPEKHFQLGIFGQPYYQSIAEAKNIQVREQPKKQEPVSRKPKKTTKMFE